jgi:hypothetical protein
MNGLYPQPLPKLTLADFGPTLDHVAEAYQGGKIFAMLHKDDPARAILPRLVFDASDSYTYVFIHGASDLARFENREFNSTFEIPVDVAVRLFENEFASAAQNMPIRLCSCYGNLRRDFETETLAERFVRELGSVMIQAYHGLIVLRSNPPLMLLGAAVEWDLSLKHPVVTGTPGSWETVVP